jgi:hypothetical protein
VVARGGSRIDHGSTVPYMVRRRKGPTLNASFGHGDVLIWFFEVFPLDTAIDRAELDRLKAKALQ